MAIAIGISFFFLLRKGFRKSASLVIIAFCAAVLWQNIYLRLDKVPAEVYQNSSALCVEVSSTSELSKNGDGVLFDVLIPAKVWPVRARVYVNDNKLSVAPGDILELDADIRQFEDTEYFAEKTYNKTRYKDVFIFAKTVKVIRNDNRYGFKHFPKLLSDKAKAMIDELYEGESIGFLRALIMGDTSLLSDSFVSDLRATGLSHTVAISGLHISFIVGFLLIFTKNKYIKLISIPAMLLFAVVVGAPQSALRAVIMQSLVLLAAVLRREYDSLTDVSFAAALLAFMNPYCVVDISFLLSFSATLGISILYEKLTEKFFVLTPKKKGVLKKISIYFWSLIAVSISATLFTTPISVYNFNYVSVISILSNILLNYVITVLFTGGFISVILGFVYMPVAKGVAFILDYIIRSTIAVIKAMAQIPFAEIFAGNTSALLFICFICVVIVLTIAFGRERIRIRVTAGAILVACVAMIFGFFLGGNPVPNDKIRFDVLDVGQGQCIVASSGENCVVIDCGGDKNAGEIASLHLMGNRIKDIDALVITHAHSDHANGIESLVGSIKTNSVYMPATDKEDEVFVKLAESFGSDKCEFVEEDKKVNIENIEIEMLTTSKSNKENEDGLVVIIRDGDYELLITGDIPSSREKKILKKLPDCESYVAGHHGARTSSSQQFLNKALPELCIVSAGLANSYGHPHGETLERFKNINATVSRTDTDGTITFYSK